MKICTKCHQLKHNKDFNKDRNKSSGLSCRCRQCISIDNKERRLANPEHFIKLNRKWRRANHEKCLESSRRFHKHNTIRMKNSWMKYQYNITIEKYNKVLKSQNGVCAICGKPEVRKRNGKTLALAIDHNRQCCPGLKSCGKCIRGLLCQHCNLRLQTIEDNKFYNKALDYLDKHNRLT